MNSVSPEFLQFIRNIETGLMIKVFLTFKTQDELLRAAAFYFERAVKNPKLADKFAETAAKFYFLVPINEEKEVNFRKALAKESKKQTDLIFESLSSASNLDLAKAVGTFKFFGELFNVGFILKIVIKKCLEMLAANKDECLISYQCYYTLIETVMKKVLEEKDDYCIIDKYLVEVIERAKTPSKIPSQTVAKDKPFSELFPMLCKPPPKEEFNMKSFEGKIKFFKSQIDKLTQTNTTVILKEVNDSSKICYEDGKWQKYYEILIEKALAVPEVADSTIIICVKIAKSHDAWQGIKAADYKKFIQQNVIAELEKLFYVDGCEAKVSSIMNFIQKLTENSLISIGSIADYIKTLIDGAEKNRELASKILTQLFYSIKTHFTAEKIKKLPEEKRRKVVQIISTDQKRNSKKDLKVIKEYFGFSGEEDETASISSYCSAKTSSAHSTVSSQSDIFNNEEFGDSESLDDIIENARNENISQGEPSRSSNSSVSSSFRDSIWGQQPPISVNISLTPPPLPQPVHTSKFLLIDSALQHIKRDLSYHGVDECVKKIKAININKEEELDYLVEALVRELKTVVKFIREVIENFGKLARAIINLYIKTETSESFQQKLLNKCEHTLLDYFKPKLTSTNCNDAYLLTQFVAELYIQEIASQEVVNLLMDVYFEHEPTCMFSVYCINIMIRTIGPKLKEKDKEMFTRYFQFFAESIRINKFSYRSNVYAQLIELRNNFWMTPNPSPNYEMFSDLPLVAEGTTKKINFDDVIKLKFEEKPNEIKKINEKINHIEDIIKFEVLEEPPLPIIITEVTFEKAEELDEFIDKLKSQLKTSSRVKNFITAMVHQALVDRQFIPRCVKTFKELMDRKLVEESFKEFLTEKLMICYAKSSCKENLKDIEKDLLSNLFIIFGELYREDIFADDNLSIWSFHKHMNQIPIQHLSHMSYIITPKVQKTGNAHVNALLANLDATVHDVTIKTFSTIAEDIDELYELWPKFLN